MSELRRPPNPTLRTLTLAHDVPAIAGELRLDRRDKARRRRTALRTGRAPRIPSAVMVEATEQLEAIVGEVNEQMQRALQRLLGSREDWADRDAIEAAARRVARIPATSALRASRMALATAERVDRFNRRDVRRAIGIDVPEFRSAIGEQWIRRHVSLIRSLPEEATQRMVGMLREAARKQTRVETIRHLLQDQFGVSYRRARLIARDQVLTLNARLNEDRQQRAGIEEYIWHTVRDGSVRSNHAHLHGRKFRWDDPPMGGGSSAGERGNPGDGIGCRCQAIPVIPEFEENEN